MPDPAFREHASGLLVPSEISRERQVWSRDEGRLLDRLTKLAASRGLTLYLGCTDPRCSHTPLDRIRQPNGDYTLRCAHCDRVFQQKH